MPKRLACLRYLLVMQCISGHHQQCWFFSQLQDTQKEILVYAHEACHVFPGFEDQCEVYVNMYGPLVLGIVQQYLQPDAMCGRLGFCPLPPPPITV